MNNELLEYRIKTLEKDMAETKQALKVLETKGIDPKIYAAIFGLIGVIFSTLGSIIGTVLTAYLK